MVIFLRVDLMVNGLNPPSESHLLSVIPGLGITRCGHMERKDMDTA